MSAAKPLASAVAHSVGLGDPGIPSTPWPSADATYSEVVGFHERAEKLAAEQAAAPPPPCSACGHTHAGPDLAGICIGCPCPEIGGAS